MKAPHLPIIIASCIAALASTGCSKFRNVPLVNMKTSIELGAKKKEQYVCQLDKNGAALELPYLYEGAQVAVCLPADVVMFTVCAERLGLAETGGSREETNTRKFEVEIPKVEVPIKADVSQVQKAEVKTIFADEGALAEARAEALRRCSQFLPPVEAKKPE